MTRPRKTALDYAIVALSPALIMAMVCSLVWFLLEVFYQGNYEGHLQFILFAFVFAAVLVSRISIEAGRERALMYGAALALVTWLAMERYVEIRGSLAGISWLINILLLAIVWWSISRLTWDCTFLDESKDTSGQGLMQAMGFDGPKLKNESRKSTTRAEHVDALHSSDRPVITRQERMEERHRRPHTHGLWVVYFSLAALPLFGIGQFFLPDGSSGNYFFWLMFIYLASGFGLLVTTSLLGLRKYLRQRKIQMPPDIAGSWLAKGAVLVILLLLVVWLLPRPQHALWSAEMPFEFVSPEDLDTSELAPGNEGKNEENDSARTNNDEQEGDGNSSDADKSGGKDEGDKEEGDPSGEEGKDGAGGEEGKDGAEPEQDGQEKDSKGKDKSPKDDGKDRGEKTDEQKKEEADDKGSSTSSGGGSGDSDSQSDEDDSSSSSSSVMSAIGNLLKWIFILAMVIIAAVFAWRFREEIVAAWKQFLAELRAFWQRLFGHKPKKTTTVTAEPAQPTAPPAVPFSSFTNPFSTGTTDSFTPQHLVQYTYEAFEAWSREHDCQRAADQTPHEFAQQVGMMHASLFEDAENLADLYCQAAFAGADFSRANVASLERLWQQLGQLQNSTAIA